MFVSMLVYQSTKIFVEILYLLHHVHGVDFNGSGKPGFLHELGTQLCTLNYEINDLATRDLLPIKDYLKTFLLTLHQLSYTHKSKHR